VFAPSEVQRVFVAAARPAAGRSIGGRGAARLDGLGDWLTERFRQHRGKAEAVRQI
jgi:hypothetical protein